MGIGKRRAGRGGGQWAVQGESSVTFLFAARVERWTLILMEGTGDGRDGAPGFQRLPYIGPAYRLQSFFEAT